MHRLEPSHIEVRVLRTRRNARLVSRFRCLNSTAASSTRFAKSGSVDCGLVPPQCPADIGWKFPGWYLDHRESNSLSATGEKLGTPPEDAAARISPARKARASFP